MVVKGGHRLCSKPLLKGSRLRGPPPSEGFPWYQMRIGVCRDRDRPMPQHSTDIFERRPDYPLATVSSCKSVPEIMNTKFSESSLSQNGWKMSAEHIAGYMEGPEPLKQPCGAGFHRSSASSEAVDMVAKDCGQFCDISTLRSFIGFGVVLQAAC